MDSLPVGGDVAAPPVPLVGSSGADGCVRCGMIEKRSSKILKNWTARVLYLYPDRMELFTTGVNAMPYPLPLALDS